MSHSDPTDEEEIHRLRRLVKELLEKQDRMAGEIHDLKILVGANRAPVIQALAEDVVQDQYHAGRDRQMVREVKATAQPLDPSDVDIQLFGSLFRGRQDVFAKMWRNAKGRTGYSPACKNEWVDGVCRKPSTKCAVCTHRDFVAMSDEVLLDHLLGRHVVGVYPLLPTGECNFLAVDFDGHGWQEDARAYLETCEKHDLTVGVERSRSGNGCHVWLFFEAAVNASRARRMGTWLLTETMSRRYEIPMNTYDRFFPNQDTLPKGGFGNLIALPLQKAAGEKGNTLFLDSDFNPVADQWAFLKANRRISRGELEGVLRSADGHGRVTGTGSRFAEDDEKPWLSVPSRRFTPPPLRGPLPKKVKVVQGNQIYVEREGLPPELLDRIRRLATFQNPEFYKKQGMRLSTALTPRMICCAEDFPEHIGIPRGCLGELQVFLKDSGVKLELSDERYEGTGVAAEFIGELTSEQDCAVRDLLACDNGVLVAPPGSGKTLVAINIIASRRTNTLILVHLRPLMEQWLERLGAFLDVPPATVGTIGGGRASPGGLIDVGMLQSLVRKGEVKDIVTEYGMVIVDECHHIPAVSFERVLSEAKSKYVYGLTATPQRRDGHHPIVLMQCGPVRHMLEDKKCRQRHEGIRRSLIVRETTFNLPARDDDPPIQKVFSEVASDSARNQLIVEDLVKCVRSGRSPILLTERREHLSTLADMLDGRVENLVVLHGGLTPKQRRSAMEKLASIPAKSPRAMVATGRFIGEGFDDARLDTLFLAMPFSFKGTIVQYSGRLQRAYPEKTEIQIYDYLDSRVGVLARMFEKRVVAYRSLGYELTQR